MNSVKVYYGPPQAFQNFLDQEGVAPEAATEFTSLVRKVDETNREFHHIVNVSSEKLPEREPIGAVNMIVRSNDYASVNEHVILNFEGFISNLVIENMYLHNPPELIVNKMKNIFPQTMVRYYDYPVINTELLVKLHNEFDKRIVGQPDVKKSILRSLVPLMRGKHKKPVVLMFYGPSGVGKTESAKYLAEAMGGRLFRKQFSMFQSNDFVTYLFGGHLYEKSFARELLERETNVVLLDEFDKANIVFHSGFYQLFDEGIFEDKNYSIRIERSIIICTSNYSSLEEIRKQLGDPIFSRFDACIKFSPLSIDGLTSILRLKVQGELEEMDADEKSRVDAQEIETKFLPLLKNIGNARRIGALVRDVISGAVLESMIGNKDDGIKDGGAATGDSVSETDERGGP